MTDEITPERLAEIKARADAATPGPWEFDELPFRYKVRTPQRHRAAIIVHAGDTVHNIPNYGSPAMGRADAAFIAEARSDVPALVAEVERLRGAHGDATHPIGHAVEEYECAMMVLDDHEVPRNKNANGLSLVGRIEVYAEARAASAEAKLKEAVKVLEPFKQLADRYDPPEEDDEHGTWDQTALATLGDIRRARAFLASLDKETTP